MEVGLSDFSSSSDTSVAKPSTSKGQESAASESGTSDSDPTGIRAATALESSWMMPSTMTETETDITDDDDDGASSMDEEEAFTEDNLLDIDSFEDDKGEHIAPTRVYSADELLKDKVCLAYESTLLQLATMSPPSACTTKGCQATVKSKTSKVGSALYIKWTCTQEHTVSTWCSQPRMSARGVHAGDFSLAMNTLLSGNNHNKVSLMLNFMGLGGPSFSFFNQVQGHYCCPGISETWAETREAVLEGLRGKEVILAGDGRNDSPGHTAQYCTYTLIDAETGAIVAITFVEKRHVQGKSPNMEREALRDALNDLKAKGIRVKRVITDAHVAVMYQA